MKLLHIDSSILGENSVSRQLSAASVANWRQRDPRIEVEYRDLAAEPLSHLSGASLAKADPAEAEAAERTMQQFLDADVIVIGAPMYNFGIPSTLKAWIDRVAVAGRTFRYTEKGPEGLAGGKKLVVAGAFGGIHAGSPTDFVEPYLRQVFGFLGITDIEFVRADGIAYGPEHRERAINAALARIAANDEELAKAA